jgi:hypothetical protein
MNLEPKLAGKPYRPANGTEGDIFMSKFCYKCVHDDYENENYCDILSGTLFFEPEDVEYPQEWIYDKKGRPVCTAFCPF